MAKTASEIQADKIPHYRSDLLDRGEVQDL